MKSAINDLKHRGLDRVLAHGAMGFARVVALSVVAVNSTASPFCCAGRQDDIAHPHGTVANPALSGSAWNRERQTMRRPTAPSEIRGSPGPLDPGTERYALRAPNVAEFGS